MAGRGVDLKNEDEVKEYLENLGIEYRFGCYREKDPTACHLLGDYLEAIKADQKKALGVYEINCNDYNHAHSCHKVGSYKLLGRATKRDPVRVFIPQNNFNLSLSDIAQLLVPK